MRTLTIPVFFLCALLVYSLSSCGTEAIVYPKPRIYPKVNYPERNYLNLDKEYCAFTFEHPDYMIYEQDTKFFHVGTKHDCWFNLKMPSLNGDLHFTYTDISGDSAEYNLYKVYNDAYEMARKHDGVADGLNASDIANPEANIYGVLFDIEGSVASPSQFMLTDSVNHAVRASLYFRSQPDKDSMMPVIDFVKTDMMGIINSFKWNDYVIE